MKNEIAISVKNISKTFRIPHNKISSVRGAFVQKISSSFKKSSPLISPFEKGNNSSSSFEKGGTASSPLFKGGTQGGFSAGYEEFKALDNVSFEVKKGEFFGIIGRNGSGKSTLLKILAGIYQADKGSVEINGMISPFLELGIGFNPELSGRDNVYLNATVLGMTKKQIDEKFDSIVAFSELERFIDQKLKNYSSGMQVRLAFSVSIHANRDILLMDEVLAVGDANFQKKCINEFVKYRENGKSIILISHDISSINKYCDRALVLEKGKINIIGNAEEVTRSYIANNLELQEMEYKNNKKVEWINSGDDFVNKFFTPIKLSIIKKESEETSNGVVNISEDVEVEIICQINNLNKKLSVGYELRDDGNNLIYWSFFTDSKCEEIDSLFLNKGLYSLRSKLPFKLLNEGEYKVNLIASIHFEEWILQPEKNTPSITFFIKGISSESSFWKTRRPGILAPVLKWEKRKIVKDKINFFRLNYLV